MKTTLVIVPIEKKKTEGEYKDDEKDIHPIAGFVLDSFPYFLISHVDILSTSYCINMNSLNILSLLHHFLCKD